MNPLEVSGERSQAPVALVLGVLLQKELPFLGHEPLHDGLFPLPYLFPYLCDHSLEACSSRFATAFLLSLVTSGEGYLIALALVQE